MNVWQWAEKNVFLEKKQSAVSGFYSADLTPYVRAMMETFTSPDWDEDITMKSSQVGFTEGVLNIIRFCVAVWPTNTIYIQDSEKEVKRVGTVRLRETLERSPATSKKLGANKDKLTGLTMDLPEMVIYLGGGHCPGTLANKPAGLGIMDDADEHPEPARGQMDNADLMRERLKVDPNSKFFLLGRPKTDRGITWREYKTGNQEKNFLPCPHCGSRQELLLERLKFSHCKREDGTYDKQMVLTESYLECAFLNCKGRILEEHKYQMNLQEMWIPTNPNGKPRKRSRHISDFYSPFVTFGQLALEWIEANESGDLVKLQRFRNARQGLPFVETQVQLDEKMVEDCCGGHKRGAVPFSPLAIVMGADKQGDVQKWVKVAVQACGDMAVIDYGMTMVEDELIDIARQPYYIPGSDQTMSVMVGLIDEGFRAKLEVRDFVQRSDGLFYSAKGRGGVQVKFTVGESRTRHKDREMIVYHFDDDNYKKLLYVNMIGRRRDILAGKLKAPMLWLPADAEEIFIKELCGEAFLNKTDRRGFAKGEWVKTGPNDFGDALKQCLVIWSVIGPELVAQAETDRMTAILSGLDPDLVKAVISIALAGGAPSFENFEKDVSPLPGARLRADLITSGYAFELDARIQLTPAGKELVRYSGVEKAEST